MKISRDSQPHHPSRVRPQQVTTGREDQGVVQATASLLWVHSHCRRSALTGRREMSGSLCGEGGEIPCGGGGDTKCSDAATIML